MLSRFLKSAEDVIHVPPVEAKESSTPQLNTVEADAMVVTRLQSGDLPSMSFRDRSLSRSPSPPPRTPKRFLRRVSRSSSVEDLDYTPPSSKKRKIAAPKTAGADLQIRTRNSFPVVEIPTIAPIPASELSSFDTMLVGHPDASKEQEDEDNKLDDLPMPVESGERHGEDEELPGEQFEEDNGDEDGRDGDDDKQDMDDGEEDEDEVKEDETGSEEGDPKPVSRVQLSGEKHARTMSIIRSKQPHSPRTGLTNLLPPELLQDEDISTAPTPQHVQHKPNPKKIKFQDLVEKMPKDRRIGSTVYKVTKPRNVGLAPKASWLSQKIKEGWIQGKTGRKWRKNQRPFSKGLFKSN